MTQAPTAPNKPPRLAILKNYPIALSILLATLVFTFMATYGLWDIFYLESFGGFYDAQADSLLSGHWDVPQRALRSEGFVRDGKWYGYFGFIPAVFRMILNPVFPIMMERWSRLSMIAGCIVTLIYTASILLRVRWLLGLSRDIRLGTNLLYASFIIAVGLGSTTIFLASRSFAHHEALIWGSAFALASYYYQVRFLSDGDRRSLLIACLLAFAAFFSRVTVGGGPVLSLILLTFESIRRSNNKWGRENAAIAALSFAIIFSTYVTISYIKFRTFLNGAPLQLYAQMIRDPQRFERTEGKVVNIKNVRTGICSYFSFNYIDFTKNFPYILPVFNAPDFPEARMDLIEPFASAPVSKPALFFLALVGLVRFWWLSPAIRRNLVIPLMGAFAGGAIVLAANAISERYFHDFLPLLVIAGTIGLHALTQIPRRWLRRVAFTLWTLAVLYSVYANWSLSILYQRWLVWGVPENRTAEFLQLQQKIDRNVGRLIPMMRVEPQEPAASDAPK